MSAQAQSTAHIDRHPITLRVTDDLARNRLTVFFRLILAIPHLVVLGLWSIVAWIIGLVAWIVTLVAGRMPEGLHNAQSAFLVYQNRVYAYMYLVADPFPPFGSGGEYPVDLEVDGPEKQNRLTVFFRIILAIPALILANVLLTLAQVLAFVGWFVALFTGKMPQGMRDLSAFCLRYYDQTMGYILLLTQRYPSLSGGPTA
jgi:hypothetical protein